VPKELIADITTVKTNFPVNKEIHDHPDQNKDSDKNEVDSASSDEDHVTESTKPVLAIDEAEISINLRSGTKIFPSRQKKVRFRLNPPKS
jgi:hypothetical protein